MIGVLCWLLKMIFPRPSEFAAFAATKKEKEELQQLYTSSKWPRVKEYDLNLD